MSVRSFDAIRRDVSAWSNAHAAAPVKALKLLVECLDFVADNGNKTIIAHFAEKAPKAYLPRLTVICASMGVVLDADVSKVAGVAKGMTLAIDKLRDMADSGESITGARAKKAWPTEKELKAAAAKEAKEAEEAAAAKAAAEAKEDEAAPEAEAAAAKAAAKEAKEAEEAAAAKAAAEAKEDEAAPEAEAAEVTDNAPESRAEYVYRVFFELSAEDQAELLARMQRDHAAAIVDAAIAA